MNIPTKYGHHLFYMNQETAKNLVMRKPYIKII